MIEEKTTIEKHTNFPLGFIGPDIEDKTIKSNSTWDKSWMRVVDYSASSLTTFISGVINLISIKYLISFHSLKKISYLQI